jgi:hypothetical protein
LLENSEIPFFQVVNELTLFVRHGHMQHHQLNVRFKSVVSRRLRVLRGWGSRWSEDRRWVLRPRKRARQENRQIENVKGAKSSSSGLARNNRSWRKR